MQSLANTWWYGSSDALVLCSPLSRLHSRKNVKKQGRRLSERYRDGVMGMRQCKQEFRPPTRKLESPACLCPGSFGLRIPETGNWLRYLERTSCSREHLVDNSATGQRRQDNVWNPDWLRRLQDLTPLPTQLRKRLDANEERRSLVGFISQRAKSLYWK